MNKFFILSIVVLLSTSTLTYSQHVKTDEGKEITFNKYSIYLELLGNGFLYSVNYERLFKQNLSIRFGASYVPDMGNGFVNPSPLITLPILFNYHLNINKNILFETGLGTTLAFLDDDSNMYFTSSIGTKFFDTKTGHFFKLSFTPYSKDMDLKSNMQLNFGLSFGKEF